MIPWHTVREFGQLLEDGELQEIEYETEEYRVRLSKQISGGPVAPAPAAAAPEATEASGGGDTASSSSDHEVIEAPMVGTFYRAPAPDADPFVEAGDQIQYDTTVCIIEAMKLMNEIEAEMEGTIQEVLVEDAEPVSKGDPLFTVEPG